MGANEHQVGGRHYKTKYEHWDLCIQIPLAYLEGCTTKYVSRARKKNGLQDYKKAMHYLDKLIECYDDTSTIVAFDRMIPETKINMEVKKFAAANNLIPAEQEYIFLICKYSDLPDLELAKKILENIILEALVQTGPIEEPNYPGTPADGSHHARMEIDDA